MALAVSATYTHGFTVVETLDSANTPAAAEAKRKVTHDQYVASRTFNATSTPAATETVNFLLTLSTGAATINLAALTGTRGATIDGTGKRVLAFAFRNMGANDMVVTPGASNGYDFPASDSKYTAKAGGSFQMDFGTVGAGLIASGDRTIDVAGTGSQTAQVQILLGN